MDPIIQTSLHLSSTSAIMDFNPYPTISSLFSQLQEEDEVQTDLLVNKTLILHYDNYNKCID